MTSRPFSLPGLPEGVRSGADLGDRPGLPLTLGAPAADALLSGRLRRDALHEVFAGGEGDGGSAAGFALLLAIRGGLGDHPVLWVREDKGSRIGGRLYPHGLADLGLAPDRVLMVHAPDVQALLRAGADIVKCGAVGAVVIEPWGKAPGLDLTASRRLSLAATRSGVMAIVLRAGADPMPSAAESRWRVQSAPSAALEANAPGMPAFDIELLRHRGGIAGFAARVEWNRELKSFSQPDLSGGLPALPAFGTGAALERRAA